MPTHRDELRARPYGRQAPGDAMRTGRHDLPSPAHDLTQAGPVLPSAGHDRTSTAHAQPSPGDVMPSMLRIMTVGAHGMLAGSQEATAPRYLRLLASCRMTGNCLLKRGMDRRGAVIQLPLWALAQRD